MTYSEQSSSRKRFGTQGEESLKRNQEVFFFVCLFLQVFSLEVYKVRWHSAKTPPLKKESFELLSGQCYKQWSVSSGWPNYKSIVGPSCSYSLVSKAQAIRPLETDEWDTSLAWPSHWLREHLHFLNKSYTSVNWVQPVKNPSLQVLSLWFQTGLSHRITE